MEDQDELIRIQQQAIINATARSAERARASIVGASDLGQNNIIGPPLPIDIDARQIAIRRATAKSNANRYAIERKQAFQEAPELGIGVGLRDMLTPLPEDSSGLDIAKRAVRNTGLSVAGATTLDPWEYGQMLMKQDPNIGVIQTPEGEFFAVRSIKDADGKITGERIAAINNLGPSPKDALQA